MTPPDKTLPLLTDAVVNGDNRVPDKYSPSGFRYACINPMSAIQVRDFYETARKEDAAKIARLEGLVQEALDLVHERVGDGTNTQEEEEFYMSLTLIHKMTPTKEMPATPNK